MVHLDFHNGAMIIEMIRRKLNFTSISIKILTFYYFRKSRCNTIRGSYDGTLFPKNAMFGEEFKLYRQAFCRTLRIKAVNETSLYGINTLHFSLADDAFDDTMNDTGTSCFCNAKRNTCMRKGLGYIGSCYFSNTKNN